MGNGRSKRWLENEMINYQKRVTEKQRDKWRIVKKKFMLFYKHDKNLEQHF